MMANSSNNGGADNTSKFKNHLSLLDRSVPTVLETPDETASSKQGISVPTERLHRIHGTSLMFEASKLLSLGASTFATACTIFHRFFHQSSLLEYDVWSVAMASTLLATKIEEEPHTIKSLVHAFAHLYRKRLIVTAPIEQEQIWDHAAIANIPEAKTWSIEEKESKLAQMPLPNNKLGPVYQEWHKRVFHMEAIVLRQLGFTLYWIPDSHPHKFILYFCRVLELNDSKFAQRAWNYCNDSCRLDLCARYQAEVIASSSILLAAQDFMIDLPTAPQPWWEIFVGKGKSIEIVTVANAILGLVETTLMDSVVASRGFVKSLIKDGSFNDPGSFLWDYQKDLFEKVEKLGS